MSAMTFKKVSVEAKLLLIGIPVFLWTIIPVYHMFLFAISPRDRQPRAVYGRRSQPCKTSTMFSIKSIFI